MSKFKNDPSTYKKRADLAKSEVHAHKERELEPLSAEKRDRLISAFGKTGGRKAGYIPFGSILRK